MPHVILTGTEEVAAGMEGVVVTDTEAEATDMAAVAAAGIAGAAAAMAAAAVAAATTAETREAAAATATAAAAAGAVADMTAGMAVAQEVATTAPPHPLMRHRPRRHLHT